MELRGVDRLSGDAQRLVGAAGRAHQVGDAVREDHRPVLVAELRVEAVGEGAKERVIVRGGQAFHGVGADLRGGVVGEDAAAERLDQALEAKARGEGGEAAVGELAEGVAKGGHPRQVLVHAKRSRAAYQHDVHVGGGLGEADVLEQIVGDDLADVDAETGGEGLALFRADGVVGQAGLQQAVAHSVSGSGAR